MNTSPNTTAVKLYKAGVSAKSVIIPAVILIFCLHLLIILNTLRINRMGMAVSRTMQENLRYSQITWQYEDGTEQLSDKVRLYISTGDEDYLSTYFRGRGQLEEQNISVYQLLTSNPERRAAAELSLASAAAQERTIIELHALRLCADAASVDLNSYPQLAAVPLSDDEVSLLPSEKKLAAARLLGGLEYMQAKSKLHEHISRAIQLVSDDTAVDIRQQSATLGSYRALQWIMTLSIVTILFVMCILLFTLLLNPLEKSVALVQNGESLPANKGLTEFRRLAYSYNELLHHRKMMETYLRKQSQTDALTRLSNRLAFQDYVSRLSWENAHSSVTVFSLDVNGLKEVNDTRGHFYGDELLRECAACIMDAFGGEDGRYCFRFGGDEFAAFWVDVPTLEIVPALEKFSEYQAARGVSISVGYAYAPDLSETTIEALFEEADQVMYKAKEEFHKRNEASKAQ